MRVNPIEIVRLAFDRLAAADVGGTLELAHPEIVVINPPAIGFGVAFPTHIFGIDQLCTALEEVDLDQIERRIESIQEVSPGVVSAHGYITVDGRWGAAQWLGHMTGEGLLNYVEGHLYFRVPDEPR